MNLFHLKYFIRLAELEHYTLAAKELNITQPSLSHAISSLENEISVKLFEKKGRNIALTRAGELFYKIVSVSVANIDEAVEYIQKINAGDGLINLGFLRTLGVQTVPTLCKKFKDENSDKEINFNFYNGYSEELITGIKSAKYDIVFTSKTEDNDLIEYIPFGKQELILIVPTDHKLANLDSIDLEEITKHDFISFKKNTGLHKIIAPNFSRIKKYPKVKYTAEEDQVVSGLVSQGFGIAIVPDMPVLETLNVKKIKINDIEQNRLFYIAHLKERTNIPIVYEFIDFLKKYTFSDYIKPY